MLNNVPLEPDAATLRAIRDRTPDREVAFRSLLDAWEPPIRAMVQHCAVTADERLDFAQVARLALLRAAERFDPAGGPFENFARRSLRNAIIDEARRAVS